MSILVVNRKSLGINFSARGEAEILVWAPLAENVKVLLVDKPVTINLIRSDFGYWSFLTPEIIPGDRYYIEIDGRLLADPASLSQPDGISGPSEVVNLNSFHWTDHEWGNIPLQEYIIYELHTGTFSLPGTFEGIIGI